jgi:tetratricopeptide (TPR) repeat protein
MSPEEVIDERFEIDRHVASGGMGHVYRARDRTTGAIVALKLLHGKASERPVRFQREVDALLALQHPGIVRYVANGATAAGVPYLVMEWLDGVTLAERLAAGQLGIEESLEVAAGIAEALAVVHAAGFIHRDLKPSNIFLAGGEASAVKLIDFGLARLERAESDLSRPGTVLGTIGYLAPEQARGEPQVDARADVFSLGCLIFRCVTGARPFTGEDDLSVLLKIIVEEPPRLRELRPAAPPALEDLVARMLAKAPSARPADAAAVAAAIAALSAPGGPSTARSRQLGLTGRERRIMGLVLTRLPEAITEAPRAAGEPRPRARPRFRDTVERHRGQLELLADGSSLVVFTSDGEATDLAARAARCALSIRALFPGAPVVLVSGRAELSGRKLVGELIDRAVELLPEAGAPAIRIDDVTAGLLGPGFVTGGDGWLSGERESLDVPRTLLRRPSLCVGRDRELLALEAAYARTIEEPAANVVLVTAAAGMGKSRLGSELVGRLRQRPSAPEIWIGRGDPMSAGSAFGLLGQALRRALGLSEGAPLSARQDRLRERVARREPRPAEAARVAEFLGELVGTPFPDDASVQLRAARRDPMLLGDQMRRAWEDFVRAECGARPVVLVLEDLHWGDLPTVKLVDAALRHLSARPFMVLAMGRPEVHQLFPDLWAGRGIEEIRLARLPRRAGELLVRAALGSEAPDEVTSLLLERADGNAFYLEELIRAVAEGKGAALPETVLAMVQARLEALHVEERRVLRAASVFGQAFAEGGVAALLGGVEVRGWLRALAEREVIVEDDGRQGDDARYRFRHALVREAAYGMLTEADRVVGHQLAAEWLEAAGETDAMVLAEHLERAGEPARAAAWFRRGAEQAFEGNDLEAALSRAERGLACAAGDAALGEAWTGELCLLQAQANRWRGAYREALARALEAMRRLPPGGAAFCTAAREVALSGGRSGDVDRLVFGAEALLALPAGDGAVAAAPLAIALAGAARMLHVYGDDPARAEAVLARAEEVVRLCGDDPVVMGHVQGARARRSLVVGDVSGYLALMEASRASFEEVGNLRDASIQAVNVGYAQMQLGVYDEAERVLRGALATVERLGLPDVALTAKHNLGLALGHQGKLDEARAVEGEAVALAHESGNRRMESGARIYLAHILMLARDPIAAAREARAVAAERSTTPAFHAYARAILADVRLAEGSAEGALADAEAAMAILESLPGIEEGDSLIRVVHADALAATGDRAGARAAVEEARARLLARAAKVVDPALRRSFLERVPENARTLARAREWGPPG